MNETIITFQIKESDHNRLLELISNAKDDTIELLGIHDEQLGRTTAKNMATANYYIGQLNECDYMIKLFDDRKAVI